MNTPTTIFVVSGPSGVGKTSLLKNLFLKKQIKENFCKAVSYTTRKCRPGEKNGKDYYFITKEEFLRLKKKNYFLEHQKVFTHYYGTPKFFLSQAKREHKHLILCIDVKGGMYLKKNWRKDKIVLIFISVPNKRELLRRLKNRKEKYSTIIHRISIAKSELKYMAQYEYVIHNNDLKESVRILESVLIAEQYRRN